MGLIGLGLRPCWKESMTIVSATGMGRLKAFADLLLCHNRYLMTAADYLEVRFDKLPPPHGLR